VFENHLPPSRAESSIYDVTVMQDAQQLEEVKANHGAFQSSSMESWTVVPVGKCDNPVMVTAEESTRFIRGPPTLEKLSLMIPQEHQ